MSEKEVGRSRNIALMMRASDDIIIVMADEDEVFVDGYEKISMRSNHIQNIQMQNMIIFKCWEFIKEMKSVRNYKKGGKVKFYNSLKYGTVRYI
ncbi:MAG: hypothetical protein ACLSIL_17545 [Enterococcus casseliflavus]